MVAMNEVEAPARRIVEEFDPEKIILFGSFAYDTDPLAGLRAELDSLKGEGKSKE